MRKEKSCGAIIYYNNKYLIIKQCKGHYSFPKGHVESDEYEEETALREIKEETNLDVRLDTNFRYVSSYSPKKDVFKDVVFFLGYPLTFDLKVQEEEVIEADFYDYTNAYYLLTYDRDREILSYAKDYIEKNSIKIIKIIKAICQFKFFFHIFWK